VEARATVLDVRRLIFANRKALCGSFGVVASYHRAMGIQTTTPPRVDRSRGISRLEVGAAGVFVAVLLVLLALEPDILQAPFESPRAVVATFGGALVAVVAMAVLIRMGVRPVVRLLVVGIPVLAVSAWLLVPFFVNTRVFEDFDTSIAAEQARPSVEASSAPAATVDSATPTTTPAPVPAGPQLLGSGEFVGLAGHDGTGDAGIFRLDDGSLVVRLENLDIDNGPDLELYLVPGDAAYSPGDGSVHLGALKGNIGDQTYEIPTDFAVSPGPWTVLVWCEAFTVEFVGASLAIA
jgi:hypothetical protein